MINSWGQDLTSETHHVVRGYYPSIRSWHQSDATGHMHFGFRPVLEVLNADALGSDGLEAVTLNLNGGKFGDSTDDIQIIVKNGSMFTAPASKGLTRPAGDTGNYFKWLGNDGKLYSPGASVPTDVTKLTAQFISPCTVTLNTNGGTINSGNVTEYICGVGATLPTPDDMTYTGHTFMGWYDNESLSGSPVTALWLDVEAPTGEIKIAENSWNCFLNKITFELFFKDTPTITITAVDNCSETVTIEYLLSDRALTKDELTEKTFTAYGAPFHINRDNEYVIYAKLTDANGNVAYINTDGIVLDTTVPALSGITNGTTYCAAQTVTVTEENLDTVTVNGVPVTLDSNGQFILSPADGPQRIIARDAAGNSSEITVTVNNGHTGGTATCTKETVCEVCGVSYGDKNSDNHTALTHVKAKKATKKAGGNIEYWYCKDCDTYYADADATKEITEKSTILKKLDGSFKESEKKSHSVETGDNSQLMVWILLLALSAGVCTVLFIRKRKTTDR